MAKKSRGLTGDPAKAKLGPKQRAEFERLRQANPEQAAAYRQNIINKKSGMAYTDNGGSQRIGDLNTPQGVISTQDQFNMDTAVTNANLNRPDETDQFGNKVKTVTDPVTGKTTRETVMSDQNQQMSNLQDQYSLEGRQQGMQSFGQAQQAMKDPYSLDGATKLVGAKDYEGERSRIEQSLYDRQANLFKRDFDKQDSKFQQMAAERGWTPGSEALQSGSRDISDAQNAQRQQWANEAVAGGEQAMQGQFSRSLQGRQQDISDYNAGRYGALNESSQLMNQGSGVQMGNLTPFAQTQMQGTDVTGAAGNFYNTNQSMSNYEKQRAFDAQQNNLNRGTQMGIAGMANNNAMTPYQQGMLDLQGRELDYKMSQGQSQGTNWGQVLSPIVSGIGQGIGSAAGGFANGFFGGK